MEHDVVPSDLSAALLRAGYRAGGPVGVGAQGPAWAAIGSEDGPSSGRRVVVTSLRLPGGVEGQAARSRLDALRRVRHEHLAEIVDVLPVAGPDAVGATASGGVGGRDPSAVPASLLAPLVPPDPPVRPVPLTPPVPSRRGTRWAVLLAEIPGPSLAVLLAARPPLSDAEAVTLVVPLAQALAALHEAGLVHADVSPANVVIRPDGRPVLIDLLGAVLADGDPGAGAGTPGFTAPERARGGRPEPSADVFALARVTLSALPAQEGTTPLRAVLERACADDPADRPDAAVLAGDCYAAAPAAPVAIPDAAILARTTLARLAVGSRQRTALTAGAPSVRSRGARRRGRVVARLGIAVVVVAGCGLAAATTAAWGPFGPGDRPDVMTQSAATAVRPDPVRPDPVRPDPARPDPVAAAVELTKRRVAVLSAGDPEALATVDLEGTAAHVADSGLLERLMAGGGRIEGLAVAAVSARLVDRGPGTAAARVEVTSALTAYRRVSGSGAPAVEVPAQPERTVVLELEWTRRGWRVVKVTDPRVVDAPVEDLPLSDPGT